MMPNRIFVIFRISMRPRFRIMKSPQAIIYQTPQQAYLILEGPSILCESLHIKKKRIGKSVQCAHRIQEQKNNSGQCRWDILKSEYSGKGQERQYRHRQKTMCDNKRKQSSAPSTFSFRDLNRSGVRETINCNYNRLLAEENSWLRKENKFLQQYVNTLESKSQDGREKQEKKNKDGVSRYASTKNSFMKRSAESSEEEGSAFARRISSRGDTQYTQYRN